MHTAKTIAEFHFDTIKSGGILRQFLSDAKISRAECAKQIGLSYDALDDSLKGRNKESKMELVVKICFLTGRTVHEWCELMLDGVNEDVAEKVRAVFTSPSAPLPPSVYAYRHRAASEAADHRRYGSGVRNWQNLP